MITTLSLAACIAILINGAVSQQQQRQPPAQRWCCPCYRGEGYGEFAVQSKSGAERFNGVSSTRSPKLELASQNASKPCQKTSEMEKMEKALAGTWSIDAQRHNGRDMPAKVLEGSRLILTRAGQFTFSVGPLTTLNGRFATDRDAKPSAIDLLPTAGPLRGQKLFGIYRLEGEQLTLCYAAPGERRPTGFEAPRESDRTLMTLTRQNDNERPEP